MAFINKKERESRKAWRWFVLAFGLNCFAAAEGGEKVLMVVRDPIGQAYDMFLEECKQGRIGVACAPNTKMCEVAECRSSSKGRKGTNCLSDGALPANYKRIGGVCNWEGFEDFLFKTQGEEKVPKNNGGLFLKMAKQIHKGQMEILKYLTETKQETGNGLETQQFFTSYEILSDPTYAKEELWRIESFLGSDLFQQAESTSSKVQKLHELVQKGAEKTILRVSESTRSLYLTASTAKAEEQTQKIKEKKNLRSTHRHNNRRDSGKKTLPAPAPSPTLLEYLKHKLCSGFHQLESVVLNRQLLDSDNRYAQVFGQSSCSSGIW